MKNRITLIQFVTFIFLIIFSSCSKEENELETENTEQQLFTQKDISKIKQWIKNQQTGKLTTNDFPILSFDIQPTKNTDLKLVEFYQNGIMYLSDDILAGQDKNYDTLKQQIRDNDRLDKNGQAFLFSFIQLSSEIFTSQTFLKSNTVLQKAPCNCTSLYNTYVTYSIQCQAYGNVWGHCTRANQYYQYWLNCKKKKTTCPTGFTFDSANCYSGIHFPSGYEPFIWGNGFYTKQNCSISTANNCCPPGFGYDSANCHYWGLYFPSDYEPFIWGNSFYVKAKCL